jgi:anionic cell wall polymer biosynthesis LytR-Cps2A-Psr (LCP) family protein
MKVNFDVSRLLLAVIIIFTAAGIILAVLTLRSNPVDDILLKNRVINILYIFEDNKKPLNAYVLMNYPATRRAAVFDIPGNLGLLINKINRVDRIDIVYDPGNTGLYETEVAKLLGIEIDFTIIIKKENLASLVDLLEGVDIFIPSGVSYRDESQFILFPSGMTLLDGDKASVYATYSIPDEELDMETHRRQRFFIGLLDRQIIMNNRLKNGAVEKLYHSFFRTNLKSKAFMRLYDELSHIDTDRINIQSVSGNLRDVSGQTLIIPHWDGNLVKEVVRQTLGTLTRPTESSNDERSYTVEVLNGTVISGLAGRTAEMLNSFGYDIISTGNADRSDYERTIIINRLSDENIVRTFAEIIRCNDIRQELLPDEENEMNFLSMDYKADFTLIIGRNFNGRYVTGN